MPSYQQPPPAALLWKALHEPQGWGMLSKSPHYPGNGTALACVISSQAGSKASWNTGVQKRQSSILCVSICCYEVVRGLQERCHLWLRFLSCWQVPYGYFALRLTKSWVLPVYMLLNYH